MLLAEVGISVLIICKFSNKWTCTRKKEVEGLSCGFEADLNVEDLFDINNKALPDHSGTYEMVSIFNSINISLLFDNLGKLNNASLQTFNSFIRERYNNSSLKFEIKAKQFYAASQRVL